MRSARLGSFTRRLANWSDQKDGMPDEWPVSGGSCSPWWALRTHCCLQSAAIQHLMGREACKSRGQETKYHSGHSGQGLRAHSFSDVETKSAGFKCTTDKCVHLKWLTKVYLASSGPAWKPHFRYNKKNGVKYEPKRFPGHIQKVTGLLYVKN